MGICKAHPEIRIDKSFLFCPFLVYQNELDDNHTRGIAYPSQNGAFVPGSQSGLVIVAQTVPRHHRFRVVRVVLLKVKIVCHLDQEIG
jgi:hypothetical protein